MTTVAYRFHSIEADGPWVSPSFPPAEKRHIVQGVIGGYIMGRPRWAEDLDGNFIYGLDAKGKEMKAAPVSAPKGRRPDDRILKALLTAADRIGKAERAGYTSQVKRRRGKVVSGYSISSAHQTVMQTIDDYTRGKIDDEAAMAVLHEYDVLMARTQKGVR